MAAKKKTSASPAKGKSTVDTLAAVLAIFRDSGLVELDFEDDDVRVRLSARHKPRRWPLLITLRLRLRRRPPPRGRRRSPQRRRRPPHHQPLCGHLLPVPPTPTRPRL
jgi:hypothetical protein